MDSCLGLRLEPEEELHEWYCLTYIAMGRPLGTDGEKCIEILVGEGDGQRQVGRSECRWENNIKVYF